MPLKSNTYDTRSTHSIRTYYCRKNTLKILLKNPLYYSRME